MLTPSSLRAKLRPYLDGLVALGKFDAHVQAETHRANRLEDEAERLRKLCEAQTERIRKLEADIEYLTRWRKQSEEACPFDLKSKVLFRETPDNSIIGTCRVSELNSHDEWRQLELPEGE